MILMILMINFRRKMILKYLNRKSHHKLIKVMLHYAELYKNNKFWIEHCNLHSARWHWNDIKIYYDYLNWVLLLYYEKVSEGFMGFSVILDLHKRAEHKICRKSLPYVWYYLLPMSLFLLEKNWCELQITKLFLDYVVKNWCRMSEMSASQLEQKIHKTAYYMWLLVGILPIMMLLCI